MGLQFWSMEYLTSVHGGRSGYSGGCLHMENILMDEKNVSKTESEEATWRDIRKWQGRTGYCVGLLFCIVYLEIRHMELGVPATAEWFYHSILYKPLLLPIMWSLLCFVGIGFASQVYLCAFKGRISVIDLLCGVFYKNWYHPFAILTSFIVFFELLMWVIP